MDKSCGFQILVQYLLNYVDFQDEPFPILIGQGISLVKDKVRDTLFGSPLSTGENSPSNQSYEYSSQEPYSSTIRNVKNNEPENDKLQLVQSQAKEKIDALKSKTKNLLKKNKFCNKNR